MLAFRPFEKNLFGQTRSWCADSGAGRYVITRSPTAETFQASLHIPGAQPVLLQRGSWQPLFDRAKRACDEDAALRLRQRIAAKSSTRARR